ncbi:hypothetical protein GPECTOR_11g60 [Gonium pectorale]|uniref:Uncharacterized protein n=1 Tax=Gonium pectorale TaxID=33097 RepID=A0A150GQ44_GONPE|nr:hypothetical protein GPECTOR_11g60 [Gonium pectorale]|eukprot:KXZ51935.1 hypothetical protein GPECTOR_11g60 [Gonium pectorale]
MPEKPPDTITYDSDDENYNNGEVGDMEEWDKPYDDLRDAGTWCGFRLCRDAARGAPDRVRAEVTELAEQFVNPVSDEQALMILHLAALWQDERIAAAAAGGAAAAAAAAVQSREVAALGRLLEHLLQHSGGGRLALDLLAPRIRGNWAMLCRIEDPPLPLRQMVQLACAPLKPALRERATPTFAPDSLDKRISLTYFGSDGGSGPVGQPASGDAAAVHAEEQGAWFPGWVR